MPLLIDRQRSVVLTEAINHLLVNEGAAALSLRAIAREARVSTSSILHHLGSREQLLRVAARHTANGHIAAIDARHADGILRHLPAKDGLREAGIWLGWAEMARTEPSLQAVVGDWHLDERATMARLFYPPPDARTTKPDLRDVEPVYAMLIGLRAATTRSLKPVPLEDARAFLSRAYEKYRPHSRWL